MAFIYELAKDSVEEPLAEVKTSEEKSYTRKEFELSRQVLNRLMSTTGKPHDLPEISMQEALSSADFSVVFKTAVSDVLQRPKEPVMIGQTILAKTITLPSVRQIEIPVLGAIRAFDIGETQEIPEQSPAVTTHMTEVKVQKVGLRLALSEDVINDSQWDLLALMLEAAGYAMKRHKEQKIFNEFNDHCVAVFDNHLTNSDAWTSGRDASGNLNGSFSFSDYVDMVAALMANEYTPTDIVLHPLAWSVWMKDPILRFQLVQNGNQGVTYAPPGVTGAPAVGPWNITTQVTPFAPFARNVTAPANTPAAGQSSNTTSIIVLDRNQALLILQRTPMSIDEFNNPWRDIREIKLVERYGLAALNGGQGAVVAKNVRLVDNLEPIPWIQVTRSVV
jgi:hypothetical protein